MSSENIGQRIYELAELGKSPANTSSMLICDNNLTRQISIEKLRNSFVGDNEDTNLNNKFYSVDKVNQLVKGLQVTIELLQTTLADQEQKINDVKTDSTNNYNNVMAQIEQILNNLQIGQLGYLIHPVGSEHVSYDENSDPSTLFGGSWRFIGVSETAVKDGFSQENKYRYHWERIG